MKQEYVGRLSEGQVEAYNNGADLDIMIRKRFKVPAHRYYSIVMSKGLEGKIFVDHNRTRPKVVNKISKSDA